MMSRKVSTSYTECTPCKQRGNALEARARVDVLLGQRGQLAVGAAVVLHEDQVPVLQEAVARAAGLAVRAVAAVLGAPVEVQLRAGAARAGRPGGPEVLVVAERDDALGGHALREPDLAGVIVGGDVVAAAVDGRPDALAIESPRTEREVERELDGAFLEVVAEREVAHHLEEGEMPRGLADLVDVDRAEDLLHRGQPRGGRRLLTAEERLERLHPAVVSSTDGSSVGGTSEADGTSTWPRSTKCSTNERRIAAESMARSLSTDRLAEEQGPDARPAILGTCSAKTTRSTGSRAPSGRPRASSRSTTTWWSSRPTRTTRLAPG